MTCKLRATTIPRVPSFKSKSGEPDHPKSKEMEPSSPYQIMDLADIKEVKKMEPLTSYQIMDLADIKEVKKIPHAH